MTQAIVFAQPEDLLREWMGLINTDDADRASVLDRLCALYDPQASLIPTFSNRLLTNPAAIREYFIRLSSREELSIALHEKTLKIHSIKEQIYALSGIYCWRFAIDGELLNFEARFSYMVDLASPTPILHHHSSQIPRML